MIYNAYVMPVLTTVDTIIHYACIAKKGNDIKIQAIEFWQVGIALNRYLLV